MKFKDIWVKMPDKDGYLAQFHVRTMLTREAVYNARLEGNLEELTLHMLENMKRSVQDHIDRIKEEGIDV
jgi:hypothetical protein